MFLEQEIEIGVTTREWVKERVTVRIHMPLADLRWSLGRSYQVHRVGVAGEESKRLLFKYI